MPSIFVESGIEEGAAYGFPPGDVVFIVGRAPNSGIVITDPLVSRQHCRIERINGRYRVVDLGSHNGTYLNDERMPKNSDREISFGDVVRIGESELVLREEAPDDEGELAGRRLGGYQ
ncbi:MAG: FHA domain-containing protein, partial [Planctomycetota bacterium]